MPEPPEVPVSDEGYALGATLIGSYCFMCYGVAAIGGGVLPDLRWSAKLADSAAWHRALREGELHDRGMADLRQYLTDADAELLRAYVARQAAMRYQEERGRTQQASRRSRRGLSPWKPPARLRRGRPVSNMMS